MRKVAPQTASFIVLVTIAMVGTYLLLTYAQKQETAKYNNPQTEEVDIEEDFTAKASELEEQEPELDTSTWKTYTDPKYNFSFLYEPTWKVRPTQNKTTGTYVVEVDPGAKYYNINIYVTEDGYFALDGLPITQTTVSTYPAVTVNELLYGVKKDSVFLTFDLGASMSLKPKFKALVNSISLD